MNQKPLSKNKITQFYQSVVANGAYTNKKNLRQYLCFMFQEISLSGKRVLDVGGGTGLLTLWAALNGANAVCLEPEFDGSTQNAISVFQAIKTEVDNNLTAQLLKNTLSDYLKKDKGLFDIIIMANSINHIDEHACSQMAIKNAARSISIF